jgi:hypothetical protein
MLFFEVVGIKEELQRVQSQYCYKRLSYLFYRGEGQLLIIRTGRPRAARGPFGNSEIESSKHIQGKKHPNATVS